MQIDRNMSSAIPKSTVSPNDGQWHRAETFIPGSADEVSDKVMAAAKLMGLSVQSRDGSAIVLRLLRRWPTSPRVNLEVSFIARSGGMLVRVAGQARRMNRNANVAYAKKVVDAFLVNAQKTQWRMVGIISRLRCAVWGLVVLSVVVADLGGAFGTWWYVLAAAWWIVFVAATDLLLRRWAAIESRWDWLQTAVLGAIAICATLAYILI